MHPENIKEKSQNVLPAKGKPFYFPVEDKEFKMSPKLEKFGTDNGQGAWDNLFFQIDDRHKEYVEYKKTVSKERKFCSLDVKYQKCISECKSWLQETLKKEHGHYFKETNLLDIFDNLQEDFVLIHSGKDYSGDVVAYSVSFPSGWRPEDLMGSNFFSIHTPVPDFLSPKISKNIVRAMVTRGPYQRFVWTISYDESLDQHPDHDKLVEQTNFRVERQVTIPFPKTQSSLFLIRVYMTPFTELDKDKKETLLSAIEKMPLKYKEYKNIGDL